MLFLVFEMDQHLILKFVVEVAFRIVPVQKAVRVLPGPLALCRHSGPQFFLFIATACSNVHFFPFLWTQQVGIDQGDIPDLTQVSVHFILI